MPAQPAPDSSAHRSLLEAARAELAEGGHAGVSLRAVARRAGLSHAAPAHFFIDRAGLLTAVATEGFRQLTERLDQAAAASEPSERLAALGRVYVDYGLEHPALVDLMFRRTELHPDDPELQEAQRASIGRLVAAVSATEGGEAGGNENADRWALVSWALVHGLVVLAREGVLSRAADRPDGESADVARELVRFYTAALPRHGG
ncbi:TetR/AcrR family transcriptional regulator [Herbiconiux sp. KACC 21604]|uniref:TetR/AcrR family transcriptional regulator n=1 Tax=unclassified Herbiconiux TaxID=2618217 RepID=UPI0014925531|nr:TetR/AcrR family transcriptional regulator [Herbiconiux sp. SALV-R1]QJU55594.1 TetR/AcrR family transcriptional regulator [Herbiconiux sp. SALV-R1]WPO86790.1 TetR/AcrR family transcriptional regulator [Herbiconiux sp. KACC 21604]